MNRHPAHEMEFSTLLVLLEQEVSQGNVNVQRQDDLSLYVYSKQCVYERNWNPITKIARGLILDIKERKIVANTFPKFFNYQEVEQPPNLPFEVYEKLDGSMISCWFHDGEWKTATKGSFNSDQAKWAKKEIHKWYMPSMEHGTTYLFEAIYPENQIVVKYDYEGLVLLGAYDKNGYEIPMTGEHLTNFHQAKTYSFNSISDLLTRAETLPKDEEGWVLKYSDGTRLKIKGAEYRRLHAAVSRITPLGVWEAMRDGVDLQFRKDIPEEFWEDFDKIQDILEQQFDKNVDALAFSCYATDHLTDKELGLTMKYLELPLKEFIFGVRKARGLYKFLTGPSEKKFFDLIRPTSNRLEGYRASFAVARVQDGDE